MEVFETRSRDAHRTTLCHGTHLDTYEQKESRPPKTTWRRILEKERTMAGWMSWEEARALVKDMRKWKRSSAALCVQQSAKKIREVTYMKMNVKLVPLNGIV